MISVLLLVTSVFMFSFPRRLPRRKKAAKSTASSSSSAAAVAVTAGDAKAPLTSPASSASGSKAAPRRKAPKFKDFPAAVRQLIKNDILCFRTASSVLRILPISGLYTFLPKYLESQFRLTATIANMISGAPVSPVPNISTPSSCIEWYKKPPEASVIR